MPEVLSAPRVITPGGRGRGHHDRALLLRDETNERSFDEQLTALMAERGIFVCPTINVNAPGYDADLLTRATRRRQA